MFTIPDNFAQFMIKQFGAEGRIWLDQLPERLASYEERWSIKIGEPVRNLSFNYVAPAVGVDGRRVMLKTGLTDEFPIQPEALRHFGGQGAVKMLAYDEANEVMLMERLAPGTSLRVVENDEAVITAATEVMRKLWRPLPEQHYPFPTIIDWGKSFAELRQQYNGGTGPIPAADFDRAEKLYAELSASMGEQVLLHGDLHHDNILLDEYEGWLAVDPKGVIGERVYETGSILRNFWPDILSNPDPRALTRRRIDQMSEELGFDRERIYSWAFAQAVLAVVWSVEDRGQLEYEGLYFVNLLNSIR
ncbi:hydroxyurea phosphotransferase [Dictyobacter sp. S3.2.2.5]|uniref:Hydroxyurea phosphotransferase n=1 Tax=Dictyobacter halimunensis TaxID=3026934 RepID=A0ABQ6FTH8_9CHLR|nr:hydroxyurea phosphotransferase [Dictyobacter sp. S3.2.2.5]